MKKIFLYLLFIILFISRADAQNNDELYISYKFISGIALEYSSSKIIPGQNIGISITGSFGFTSKPNSEFDLSTFSEAILAFPNRGKTASRYIYNIYSVVFLRHSHSNAYFNPDFKLGYMRMSPEQNPKLKRYNSIRFSFQPLFGKKRFRWGLSLSAGYVLNNSFKVDTGEEKYWAGGTLFILKYRIF